LPNYRFIGLTPRFYPDERGADGRSLMAMPGRVRDWEHTPDDGLWAIEGDAPETPDFPAPDPAPEPPEEVPVPEAPPVVPEPSPAPVAPPEPAPEPVQPALTADWFSSLSAPPARA
jgi:hypothetical protein